MAIVEVSVVPIGTSTPSVSRYVARAIQILREQSAVKYELTAMGTIIEGDLEQVMTLVKEMHRSAFNEGVQRVVTTIKIDERRDKPATIDSKVTSVHQKLKR
ncbi:MTH1187 family thiamine-binding protein [Chloroflexota bacterium]